MNQELHARLVQLAQSENYLTTYGDIGGEFGLDVVGSEEDRDLQTQMLYEIARYEQSQGNPMLTSLVIHAGRDNNPGEGYFALATEFGLYNGSRNTVNRVTFWASQVTEVRNHWHHT